MIECPSRFTLVQLHTGDLATGYADILLSHVRECRSCAAHLEEIRANSDLYAEKIDEKSGALNARLAKEPVRVHRLLTSTGLTIVTGALAAAAVISVGFLFVFHPAQDSRISPTESRIATSEVSYKGAFSARIFASRAGTQFAVEDDTVLKSGDQLRFVVEAGAPGFLCVVSVAADGTVSPFYPHTDPETDRSPLAMTSAGQFTLPGSIVLDDSTGTEHLIVLYSQRTFDRKDVQQKLAKSNILSPGLQTVDGIAARVVRVRKEK